jgi:hypothetical protein
MFNTRSYEFFTVLKKPYGHDYWEQSMNIFETHDESIDYIKDNSSWDCRPTGGSVDEWYDPGSGLTYKIVSCDDCGRIKA